MKRIIDTMNQMVEFCKKQRAFEIRKLKTEGKSEKSVKVDAYSQIIDQFTAILEKGKRKQHD